MSIIYNTLSRLETEGAGQNGDSWSAIPPPAPAPSMGLPVKALTATLLLLFAGTGLAVWHWSDQLGSLKELALANMGSPSAQQGSGYQPYPVTRNAAIPVATSLPVVHSGAEISSDGAVPVPAELPEKAASKPVTPPAIAVENPLHAGPDETALAPADTKPNAHETPGKRSSPVTVAVEKEAEVAAVAAPTPEPAAKETKSPGPAASVPAEQAHSAQTGKPAQVAGVKPATTATSKAKPRPASNPPRPKATRAPAASSPEAARSRQVERTVEQARVALSQGRYVEALTVLNGLDPAPADRADFWLMKGSAHLGLGQLGPAETAFAAAQPLAPANAQIAVQRAILKQEQDDHAGALRILEEASSRHPDVPEVFLNQGYSQQELGAVREAGHSYRIFLRLTEGRSLYADQRRAVRQWLAQLGRGTGG